MMRTNPVDEHNRVLRETVPCQNQTRWCVLRESVKRIQQTGDILEFGVFRGESINILAELLPKRNIFGFDSFMGLPEDWVKKIPRGHFSTQGKLPVVPKNVKLVKGWFKDSLPKFFETYQSTIALCHIDCDLYSSTKTVLKHIRPFINLHTIIVFDEFINYTEYSENEMKAWLEFAHANKLNYRYLFSHRLHVSLQLCVSHL